MNSLCTEGNAEQPMGQTCEDVGNIESSEHFNIH